MPVQRWAACGAGELIWRHWETDEWLVYHVPSGETHLLNDLAAAALQVLQQECLTLDSLMRHLSDEQEVEADCDLQLRLEELLQHFDEHGLIESVR